MNIKDTVIVTSHVAHKHYKHVGKIIKECNSKWKKMFLVEFGINDRAKFYEDSLKIVSLDMDYIKGMYI